MRKAPSRKDDNRLIYLFNLRSDSEASSRTATKVSTAATTIKSVVSKRGAIASFTPSATSSRFPFTQRWELPMAGMRKKSICKQNYISATFGQWTFFEPMQCSSGTVKVVPFQKLLYISPFNLKNNIIK